MGKTINLREVTERHIQNGEKQINDYGVCRAKDAHMSDAPVIVKIDDELVKNVLDAVRHHGDSEKRWDINQVEGEIAEDSLAAIMNSNGNTVEVKRDFKVSETGNLAIEYMCGGQPSGISTSQAEWWAYQLDGDFYNGEVIVLVKKKRLERLLVPARTVRGGDRNKAEMFLVRVEELVKGLKGQS